ncbi:M20/M25/M40 family metallo-hydrolase [Bosea sp. TAF32]|uniref:M20/M25/M40 family metallo-hydrolase n=1 Tax=Bosea sp. TAF32 TaxID=3237482 RepID=UPI003F8F7B76
MTEADSLKQRVLGWIERDREEIIAFLSAFLQAKSPNPPGDTRLASAHVERFLTERELPFRVLSAQEHLPNIVGSVSAAQPGRHLVLNGHMDVFPAIEELPGQRSQWSGEVTDGRIYGRGAADMKCGTTASIYTYRYLAELMPVLRGRLTLTVVSDEETGGRYGTRHLMETIPEEVIGDCCLNGEPSGLATLRFGEKGALRMALTVRTRGAHGAYPHLSESAIKIACRLATDLEALAALLPELPETVSAVIGSAPAREAMNISLGDGAADIADRTTVNIGVIRGGLKVNMLPDECLLEVEVRMPPGLSIERVESELAGIIARYPMVTRETRPDHSYPSSWCDPEGDMVGILRANTRQVTGREAVPIVSLGGSDARYWRWRGVPAYLYGPSPKTMGHREEHVTLDELFAVLRVHALSAIDYLATNNGGE